jgi:hypothetical protein
VWTLSGALVKMASRTTGREKCVERAPLQCAQTPFEHVDEVVSTVRFFFKEMYLILAAGGVGPRVMLGNIRLVGLPRVGFLTVQLR